MGGPGGGCACLGCRAACLTLRPFNPPRTPDPDFGLDLRNQWGLSKSKIGIKKRQRPSIRARALRDRSRSWKPPNQFVLRASRCVH